MITDAIASLLSASGIPDPPPAEPFALLKAWYDDARTSGRYDDPNAMAIATATPNGRPSVRIVLCKSIDAARGTLTFFTNYQSRKGRELESNPRAAVVFHWPHAQKQVRVEGRVERTSDAESDEYFATRPILSRIGAAASRQSTELPSRAHLISAALKAAASAPLHMGLKRPAWWGGYTLVADEVELWSACEGRLHQRVRWRRASVTEHVWTHALLSP